jgi:hypothetical protein
LQVNDQGVEGDEDHKKFLNYKYPAMSKTQGSFTLHVRRGRRGTGGQVPETRAISCRGRRAAGEGEALERRA